MFASTFGLRDPDRRFAPSGMMTLDFFSVALLIAKIVATRGSELARESATRATAKIASKLTPTHCMTRLETRSARRPDWYRLIAGSINHGRDGTASPAREEPAFVRDPHRLRYNVLLMRKRALRDESSRTPRCRA